MKLYPCLLKKFMIICYENYYLFENCSCFLFHIPTIFFLEFYLLSIWNCFEKYFFLLYHSLLFLNFIKDINFILFISYMEMVFLFFCFFMIAFILNLLLEFFWKNFPFIIYNLLFSKIIIFLLRNFKYYNFIIKMIKTYWYTL
jgi:hypothetical protein